MAQEPHEGVVTVLFTDIVGSAALKTSQGDVAAQNATTSISCASL